MCLPFIMDALNLGGSTSAANWSLKGNGLVQKNDLPQAVKYFARASIVGFKAKSYSAASIALERYIEAAKSLVIKSVLRGAKTKTFEGVSKLQREIAMITSGKNMESSLLGSSLELRQWSRFAC